MAATITATALPTSRDSPPAPSPRKLSSLLFFTLEISAARLGLGSELAGLQVESVVA